MKLIILKDNFKKGLAAVERVITENSNLPILKNVLIKTLGNKIKISATNLEIAITKFTPGKIIEEGGLTVPFSSFYNIIANTDSEKINLETEKNNLIIKTENYQAKIQGVSEEEFPIIPEIKNKENFVEIESGLLKNVLTQIYSSAQVSEIRPELSGVLFDFQNTVIKIAATDSFRLSESTLQENDFKTNLNQGLSVIIPLKVIQEVTRVFPDEGAITIKIDENQVMFKNENQEIISRLIDNKYPDYNQIIPKEIETEMVLNKERLLNAIKLVGALSSKINDIKFALGEGGKTLNIYSASQHVGENSYLIPVKSVGGEFKKIVFNWRYLLDGIRPIKTEDVFMGINGDNKPALIKAVHDRSYLYVIMPIKSD